MIRRILFLAWVEVLHLVRDRASLAQLLLLPFIQLVILANAATFAIRDTPLLLKTFEALPDRQGAMLLLADGFDMLEEDFEEERFFVAVRRTYWAAPDGSATRQLCEQLITRLDF